RTPEPLVAQPGVDGEVRAQLPVVLQEDAELVEAEMSHIRRDLPDARIDAENGHPRRLVLGEVEEVVEGDAGTFYREIGIVLDETVLAAELQRVIALAHGDRVHPVKRVLDEDRGVRRQVAEGD